MEILRLALLLAVLGWSAISVVTYLSRRSGNKGALRTLQQQASPLRRLTAEEAALVEPFLVDPQKPRKRHPLRDDGVYRLAGEFIRHGLQTAQGGTAMHDTLGGIDVVLPYDARDFLAENNRAEVALTDRFAIVVALNDGFTLAQGREREQRRRRQSDQWQSGRTGAMQNVSDPEDLLADSPPGEPAAQAARELEDAMRVEILGQRDETPAEVAARSGPGAGIWPALLWALAFGALAFAIGQDSPAWMAGGAAPAAAALWVAWRRRRLPEPGKVNRVRGELHAVVLTDTRNTETVRAQLFVGDKLPVSLPAHWQDSLKLPDDLRVDMDLRVSDYGMLRLGRTHSVDEDIRRHPPVYWGRHLTLALTGLAALVLLWLALGNPRSEFLLAGAWLRGAEPRAYDSPEGLMRDLPAVGAPVALSGEGRCDPAAGSEGGFWPADCRRLRWGGQPVQAPRPELDESVLAVYSGAFLRTRANPVMDALVRMAAGRAGGASPYPYPYGGRRAVSVETVAGLSEGVLAVEQACAAAGGSDHGLCASLKGTMAEQLVFDGPEPEDWGALLDLARKGELKGRRDTALVNSRAAEELRRLGRESMGEQVRLAVDKAAGEAARMRRGGVALRVAPGPHASLPQAPEAAGGDLLARWRAQALMLSAEGGAPFRIEGIVIASGRDEAGSPLLAIDASLGLSDPWRALATALAWTLAALLVLAHAPLWLLRLRAARARERALAQDVAQRAAAAGPAFF